MNVLTSKKSAPAAIEMSTTAPLAAIDAGRVETVTVQPGDSYWAIAEHQLGARATAEEVARLTDDLIDLNNPILAAGDPSGARNYDVRAMIHPGDTVYLRDPAAAVPPPRATAVAASYVVAPPPVLVR